MSKDFKYFGMLESNKLDPSTPFEERFKFIKENILKTAKITSLDIGRKNILMQIHDEDYKFTFILDFHKLEELLEMKTRLEGLK
jgi:hypothetical protein